MERLRKYIAEEGLDQRNRKRQIVYRRFYLAAWLRDQEPEATLEWIGSFFNKKHDWTIHALKEYDKYKDDKLFLSYTRHVRSLFVMGEADFGINQSMLMFQILAKQNRRLVVI